MLKGLSGIVVKNDTGILKKIFRWFWSLMPRWVNVRACSWTNYLFSYYENI